MTVKKLGQLVVAPILKITDLTPKNSRIPVKGFELELPSIAKKAHPGQFVMMWEYGNDEKPMGVAGVSGSIVSFAVAKMGEATTKFHHLKEGDLLGIRGPFGIGFSLKGKKIAVMGGGTGIAPIKYLVETALEKNIHTTLFHGARTANELAYYDYFLSLANRENNFEYRPSTDDGTQGFHGFSTDCLKEKLKKKTLFDGLYCCGPELMMYTAWKIATSENIAFQASLADRYFKCAIGLCGQCTVDPIGLRLCIDGPVLDGKQLALVEDFGKFTRDKYGRKIPIGKE